MRQGNHQPILLRGLASKLEGPFGIAKCIWPGGNVGLADGQFRHFHHVGGVFGAPPNDHFVGSFGLRDKWWLATFGFRRVNKP